MATDVGEARFRLEVSQALIWVANLGKSKNTDTVDLSKAGKRLGTSISMLLRISTTSFVLSVTLNRARDYSRLSRRHLRLMDEGERIVCLLSNCLLNSFWRKDGKPIEVLRVHDVR